MRKIITIVATTVGLGAIAVAAPTGAQARFGAGAIADAVADVARAEPAQYYYGPRYRAYRGYRGAYAYAPGYFGPRYRYRRYPGSRDALDTCRYC